MSLDYNEKILLLQEIFVRMLHRRKIICGTFARRGTALAVEGACVTLGLR